MELVAGQSKEFNIALTPIALPPELSLSLELEPALIYRGTEVYIHGIVTNIGTVAGYYSIDF